MANPSNRGVGFPEQQRAPGTRAEEQAAGVLGTMKEKASEVAGAVASTAEQAWDTTRHAAQNVASSVASTAEDAWDSMSHFMRRYPMATLFIGAGFGFLLAELFTRRRS
jgi:ElaB/YqjD/DUF883 family membrane-anchored ribosome-binding protein